MPPGRVPLSNRTLTVLETATASATRAEALESSSAKRGRPLSNMTLAAVLKRLKVPVSVHGFRSTFRDWAEEATAFTHDVKGAALARTLRNKVEAAYRRTDLYEERRVMMVAWAHYAGHGGQW